MGANSKIEWTNHTFNPHWGCTKLVERPACLNCYAEVWAKRCGQQIWGDAAKRRLFKHKHFEEPLKWNKQAADQGGYARVFLQSMGDFLEDRRDLDLGREKTFDLIAQTPNLIWMILTKRIYKAPDLLPMKWFSNWPENVWFGVTIENEHVAAVDLRELMRIPAPVRFISAEPLLGSIVKVCERFVGPDGIINWVIAGGERTPSPAKSRMMHPLWVTELRDICLEGGIKFCFKDWGDWRPVGQLGSSVIQTGSRQNRIASYHPNQRDCRDYEMTRCKKGSESAANLFGRFHRECPVTL